MATIGGVSCDILRGRSGGLKESVEVWEVPGQSGYGAMTLGDKDSPFRYDAIKFDTNANVTTWIAALEALQGTSVSIVDDFGDTLTNMLIQMLGQPDKQAVFMDGATKVRGQVEIVGVKLS